MCRIVNLAVAVLKIVAAWLSRSSSLSANAVDSACLILTDVVTLFTITFSLQDVNERFLLGYGKVDTLGGIGLSVLLR
jgi:divalent metal cation (Fe/Co/Zn/Cd) transporter